MLQENGVAALKTISFEKTKLVQLRILIDCSCWIFHNGDRLLRNKI